MLTTAVVNGALGICLVGIFWRFGRWFRSKSGPESVGVSAGQRLKASLRMGLDLMRRPRTIVRLMVTVLWEILFQGHLLRQNRWRWAIHMGLCYGFLLLVVMHALDDWSAPLLFPDYAPTLNPYRWLRNLFAALLAAAALGAVFRQPDPPLLKLIRSRADRLMLILLAAIVVSGLLLESAQIISPRVFDTMVEDFMGDDDPDEVAALRKFWAAEFGAVPGLPDAVEARADMAAGRTAHEMFCADCHSRPQSAFLSYPLSRALKPAAGIMDALSLDRWLWMIHYLSACLALACLPFSKFFHLLATPLNLVVRATGPIATAPPALKPTLRALGMDACTHCGACNSHCAVAPIYRIIPNAAILPSEKLQGVKKRSYAELSDKSTASLLQGSSICTLCGRCTAVCPAGIELQDLWQASRQDLLHSAWGSGKDSTDRTDGKSAPDFFLGPVDMPLSLGLTDRPETFWACVQCTTCTSVCPVVAASDAPHRDLDLTPQQIMNLMRLQLKDQALGCRMLWDCVTCYKCQEHCPQNVKVADVLYELRNEACRRGIAPAPAIIDAT